LGYKVGTLTGQVSQQRPHFGALGVDCSIIRIELDGAIEVGDRFAKIFDVAAAEKEMPLQISVVRFHVRGGALRRLVVGAEQRHLK
jgi:hypothetical protein